MFTQKINFHFLFFIGIALCFASCSSSKKAIDNNEWKLSWSDEFNYNGLPDSTKWSYDVGGNGWGNNELEYYTNSSLANASVNDGTLKIKAIHENKDGRNYTSARLLTKGKKEFTYGKIEIRAKLPQGRGLWPAIWMLGANAEKTGWPLCGEIDIMEHVGYEKDSILGTIHTKAYNHVIGTQKSKKTYIENPYEQFHLYSIEWTPEKIDFFLDNKLYNHFENEHKTIAEWPFDSPFFLIMNIAVGGGLGGKMGVDESVFPATLEVDYVRVYSHQ
jgi:beta-glucanase (GH16 family)